MLKLRHRAGGRGISVDRPELSGRFSQELPMSRMFKDPMPPLRRRMIEDMVLAGLARRTQLNYLYAVRRLAAELHRSPDLMTEEEVRGYLLGLRGRGVARGSSKPATMAFASSTARLRAETGRSLEKKDTGAQAKAATRCPCRHRGAATSLRSSQPGSSVLLFTDVCMRPPDF